MNKQKPIIGLLYGEAAGIGSELVVKALQENEVKQLATWVLIGDERVFLQGKQIVDLPLTYKKVDNIDQVNRETSDVWMIDTADTPLDHFELGKLSAQSGKSTGDVLTFATKLAQDKKLDTIVYAPLNKEALYRGGYQFEDEIHFLASLFEQESGFGEVNVMEDLWVTRVTSHIPIKDVAKNITKSSVYDSIVFANGILHKAGIAEPKISVCALNPHGGEGGLLGNEEIEEISPAIKEAQGSGIKVEGPYPADTILLRKNEKPFDCLLAMYHDQAQTGMKLLGFHKGVTVTGGLPVVFTTPAHGTAFDIAGKGKVNPGAMLHAMKLAVRMAKSE